MPCKGQIATTLAWAVNVGESVLWNIGDSDEKTHDTLTAETLYMELCLHHMYSHGDSVSNYSRYCLELFNDFHIRASAPKACQRRNRLIFGTQGTVLALWRGKNVQDITYKKIIIAGNIEWVAKKEAQVSKCIKSQEEREATVLGQTWKLHENDGLWGTGYMYMRVFWLTDNSIGEL